MSDDVVMYNSYSTSRTKLFKVKHFWKIEDFSLINKNEELTSMVFSGGANGKTVKWQLKSIVDKSRDAVDLYLHQVSENDESFTIKGNVKFAILNTNNEWYLPKQYEHPDKILHPVTPNAKLGSDKLYDWRGILDPAQKCLTNDCLTLVAEITAYAKERYVTGKDDYIPFDSFESPVWENFGALLQTKRFSDVTLVAENQKYQAHKSILATRSQVFDAMFGHEMKETQENRVEIKDIDPEVVEKMLLFMYTGKSPKLDRMAKHLLAAAEKYALDTLKILCEKKLYANLTVENAAETLILADLYNAKQLKAQTINFINAGRTASVMDTPGWKGMTGNHLHLVNEAFRAILK